MVRRGLTLGLALFLTSGVCLQSGAQAASPQTQPVPAAASTVPPKVHSHGKKAAPAPPVVETPAPPPTLEQSPPTAPQVNYSNGQLTVVAQNATLSQVLRSVQSLTGASVEMPSGVSSERVVGQFGPGRPRDVLNALLNGSKFNYIILGVNGDPGAVQKVILTTAKPASTVNTAQNNQAQEEPQDEEYSEPEAQPQPQAPMPPQFRHRPNMPGRTPDSYNQPPQPQPQPGPDNSVDNSQFPAAKTPEQLMQELQQMQQQQQQIRTS